MLLSYEQNILTSFFGRSTTLSSIANFYLALGTGSITNPETGGGWSEVVGNNYARVLVPNDAAHWVLGSVGADFIINNTAITWPAATPAGWGTVRAVALFTTLTSTGTTNMVHVGGISDTLVAVGDTPYLTVGALQIQFSTT